MKKQYETPDVEVVKFQYSDQVVATSCTETSVNEGYSGTCDNWDGHTRTN